MRTGQISSFSDFFADNYAEGPDSGPALLRSIECPTVYLKAATRYGEDGVLYAATSDEDAARVRKCLAECAYIEIDSGHDIHVERPGEYIEAVARLLPSVKAP